MWLNVRQNFPTVTVVQPQKQGTIETEKFSFTRGLQMEAGCQKLVRDVLLFCTRVGLDDLEGPFQLSLSLDFKMLRETESTSLQ